LMSGKKVIASSSSANPFDPSMEASGLNQGTMLLKRRLKEQLNTLKGFGIELIDDMSKLVLTAKRVEEKTGKKSVLTADDIQQARTAGHANIMIENNTIITPLARDVAKQYGITIEIARGGEKMELGIVVGRVTATRKDENLVGTKLLITQPIGLDGSPLDAQSTVTVDTVGAGMGEKV